MTAKKHRETVFLAVTDIHYGKQTGSFDLEAVKRRMDLIPERLAHLTGALRRGYEFDKLVVGFLGDFNDGTDIYRTQPHHQAETNVEAQAIDVAELVVTPFVRALCDIFPAVDVHCVAGNHGRAGFRGHEAASWDVASYRYAQKDLKGQRRLCFELPRVVPTVQPVVIRGHKFLLYHGHGVKGYQGIPFYGLRQRGLNWQSTAEYGGFRVLHVGHFHTFGRMNHNRFTIMLNGTMVSDDEWARDELGYESDAIWHLHGVSDERPITWDFGLETGERPAALEAA